MIGPDQVVNGVTIGLIFLLLGLAPEVLQAFSDGLERWAHLFSLQPRTCVKGPSPRVFIATGVVLIVVTFAAYYAK
jgi:hypothetical protein